MNMNHAAIEFEIERLQGLIKEKDLTIADLRRALEIRKEENLGNRRQRREQVETLTLRLAEANETIRKTNEVILRVKALRTRMEVLKLCCDFQQLGAVIDGE